MKIVLQKILLFFLFVISGSVWSASVLDQSFVPTNPNYQGTEISTSNFIQAQTFTSGLDGELAQIDIFVSRFLGMPSENLNVMLLGTTLGSPDISQIFANISLLSSEVPVTTFSGGAFVSVDMTSFHIPVVTGESFAIALQSNELSGSGSIYSWEIAAGDPYAGGNLFLSPDSGINFYPSGSPFGSSDVGFRTHVNISPVPEPETYAMLLIGLGLVGFMMRKRRKYY